MYAIYNRPEASWRDIKLRRYPADLVIDIETGQTLTMGRQHYTYPYVLFLPAGIAHLGRLADAFIRIVKKGADGNIEWSSQQHAVTSALLEVKPPDRGNLFARSHPARLAEYHEGKDLRRSLQRIQEAHDVLVQSGACSGRELGECLLCTGGRKS